MVVVRTRLVPNVGMHVSHASESGVMLVISERQAYQLYVEVRIGCALVS
jgi:hypothetical protein